MLPKGCCRVVYYSTEYVHSYKCNFLGISSNVSVPVETALCVVIDANASAEAAVSCGHYDEVMPISGPHSMLLYAADTDDTCDLSLFHYSVLHSSKALPSKGWGYGVGIAVRLLTW